MCHYARLGLWILSQVSLKLLEHLDFCKDPLTRLGQEEKWGKQVNVALIWGPRWEWGAVGSRTYAERRTRRTAVRLHVKWPQGRKSMLLSMIWSSSWTNGKAGMGRERQRYRELFGDNLDLCRWHWNWASLVRVPPPLWEQTRIQSVSQENACPWWRRRNVRFLIAPEPCSCLPCPQLRADCSDLSQLTPWFFPPLFTL